MQAVPVLPVSIWAVLYNHMLFPAIPWRTLYSSIDTLFSKNNDKRSIEFLCFCILLIFHVVVCVYFPPLENIFDMNKL